MFTILTPHSSTGQTGNTGVAGLESGERPYSVSRLSKKDVEDIWMTVLTRFTKAAYLGASVKAGSQYDATLTQCDATQDAALTTQDAALTTQE